MFLVILVFENPAPKEVVNHPIKGLYVIVLGILSTGKFLPLV